MTVFASGLDVIYGDPNFGVPAVYTPKAGAAFDLTILWERPIEGVNVSGIATRLAKTVAKVRVWELADPQKGDMLTILSTGASYTVGNRDLDDLGFEWTLDVKGQGA